MSQLRCALMLGLLGVLLLQGCREKAVVATSDDSTGSVQFRIQGVKSAAKDSNTKTWLATYEAGGKAAQFRIELTLRSPSGNLPIAFTSGAFYRETASDSSILLRDLARALEAKTSPKVSTKRPKLPFSAAILGRDLSRSPTNGQIAGSFVPQPKGTWITTKVFVADGEGEFYLNLDPAGGQGEISIKDPEYGDAVMNELAAVL